MKGKKSHFECKTTTGECEGILRSHLTLTRTVPMHGGRVPFVQKVPVSLLQYINGSAKRSHHAWGDSRIEREPLVPLATASEHRAPPSAAGRTRLIGWALTGVGEIASQCEPYRDLGHE